MELLPVFDKNAAYIWAVYALAALTLGSTVFVTVRRARAAEQLVDKQKQQSGSMK